MKQCLERCLFCLPLRLGVSAIAIAYVTFHCAMMYPYILYKRLPTEKIDSLKYKDWYGKLFNYGIGLDVAQICTNGMLFLTACYRWRWGGYIWCLVSTPLMLVMVVRLVLLARYEVDMGNEIYFFGALGIAIVWCFFMVYSLAVVVSFQLEVRRAKRTKPDETGETPEGVRTRSSFFKWMK